MLLWHDFYKELQGRLDSQEKAKTASLYVLREFYLKPYLRTGFTRSLRSG